MRVIGKETMVWVAGDVGYAMSEQEWLNNSTEQAYLNEACLD